MTRFHPPMVAVVGKGRNAERHDCDYAFVVGRTVADARWTLVQGGLGGTMRSSASGAFQSGGYVISVLPVIEGNHEGEEHDDADLKIRTGLHHSTRNIVTGSMVDVMIALPGSHGTAQEQVVALDAGRPVIYMHGHVPPVTRGCIEIAGMQDLRVLLGELRDRFCDPIPERDAGA